MKSEKRLNFVLVIVFIACLVEKGTACKGLWDNSCTGHGDCCSNNCFKEPHWAVGVCKPGSGGSQPSGGSSGGFSETGICSWYGEEAHGHHTASGQIYNMHAMTAAHKTLPFFSRVAVSCNGRNVVLTVNDRGPFTPGRILDVSKAAADSLGIVSKGLCHCTIRVV